MSPHADAMPGPTSQQIYILNIIDKIGASISIVAMALMISSLISSKKLRTCPNIFLVDTSVAYFGSSIALLISHDGLNGGQESATCKAQAILFQW